MIVNYNLLVLLLCCISYSASGETTEEPTTTRIYDINLPGASPIRIVEGESLWKRKRETTLKPASRLQHRSFTTATATTNLNSPLNDEQENNSAEFSHSALRDFLDNYAEKVVKDKRPEHGESDEDKEGKKSWSLLSLRDHSHPYEDKKGWVSLEPVPWSLSKISKWQSKSTTTERPYWDNYQSIENKPPQQSEYSLDRVSSWNKPTPESNYHYNSHPGPSDNKYHTYYVEDDKPSYSKPSAVFGQTVHLHTSNYPKNPIKINTHHNHDRDCNHQDENVGIITDGKPSNFPSNYYENRRIGTELHTGVHPHMGDGEWVLLSTTKGYKHPKSRQRSLDINPQSIGTHQSVKLTVLPPLKNSKVNMTTSHGGLLQVDSTFETVEQAQKKFVKLQKVKNRPKRPIKTIKKKKPGKELSSTIATIPRNTPPDSSAVLAAVGAGMIPATMAMLVPIALNGKRRKRRDIVLGTRIPSSNLQITLPRYL